MGLEEAIRIVTSAMTVEGRITMSSEDFLRIQEAQAVLAAEYIKTLGKDE